MTKRAIVGPVNLKRQCFFGHLSCPTSLLEHRDTGNASLEVLEPEYVSLEDDRRPSRATFGDYGFPTMQNRQQRFTGTARDNTAMSEAGHPELTKAF